MRSGKPIEGNSDKPRTLLALASYCNLLAKQRFLQLASTLNNTAFQNARRAAKLERACDHDLRHAFGQRLREAGVTEEDRAWLLGHALTGMPQRYATATIARVMEAANKVRETRDRTTLLQVVNG